MTISARKMRILKFLVIQPRYKASGVIEEFDLCRYEQFLGIRSVDGRVNRCFKTDLGASLCWNEAPSIRRVPKMRKKTFPQVGHYNIITAKRMIFRAHTVFPAVPRVWNRHILDIFIMHAHRLHMNVVENLTVLCSMNPSTILFGSDWNVIYPMYGILYNMYCFLWEK